MFPYDYLSLIGTVFGPNLLRNKHDDLANFAADNAIINDITQTLIEEFHLFFREVLHMPRFIANFNRQIFKSKKRHKYQQNLQNLQTGIQAHLVYLTIFGRCSPVLVPVKAKQSVPPLPVAQISPSSSANMPGTSPRKGGKGLIR